MSVPQCGSFAKRSVKARLQNIGSLCVFLYLVFTAVFTASAVAEESQPLWLGRSAPERFIPPFLDPTGAKLRTQRLANNVYALLSDQGAIDNNGFVVGDRGVLVIDSHINAKMAQQIIQAVAGTTNKPILYVANTNYHGDHTFGNNSFPKSTQIVVQKETARQLTNMDLEKEWMIPAVRGNTDVYKDVVFRKPTIVFDRYLSIDLGGVTVELHHFGSGSTDGDTVVYVPSAKTAWTGNLVVGKGTLPPLFEGKPARYLETIRTFRTSLEVETVVPGHGELASGSILERYETYLDSLVADLNELASARASVEEALQRLPIDRYHKFPEGTPDGFVAYVTGLHRLAVHRSLLQLLGRGAE